jgi:hypothetical protein
MATNKELDVFQKTALYELLRIKTAVSEKGVDIPELREAINRLRASMTQEDVSYVEKIISEV